jgi:hypothetical protein
MNAYRESMLAIFKKYLETKKLDDESEFFSYEIIEKIKSAKLMPLHSEYLASDFMEIINHYHDWTMRLLSWSAWNDLLKEYCEDEEKAWEIRSEFLEPTVFFCLHQPSSFKDLLIKYCTIAFHFGNLNRFSDYKDELVEDDEIVKRLQRNHPQPYKFYLSREKAEKQLREISSNWSVSSKLFDAIQMLDNKNYEMYSQGWRNHAAHYIPPRLSFGDTRTVTRSVQFRESWIKNDDDTLHISVDKNRKQISYGFGYTPPLDSQKIFEANSQQKKYAQQALNMVHDLLNEIVSISLMEKLDRLDATSLSAQFTESSPLGEEFGAKVT